MTHSTRMTRRRFLAAGLLGGGALAMSTVPVRVLAQDGERISEDDPAAQALGYKHDAADVDTGKFPKRAGADNQFCYNCALYQGSEGDAWAPCSIFQNRLVAGPGWCNAWVAKPA